MRVLLTLDYELFFGSQTGSVEASMIEPTQALLKIAERKQTVMVFFVDIAYVVALRREMHKDAKLRRDHDLVCRQIEAIAKAGHEVQLHIHSHWEDCRWENNAWTMDVRRYRLQDFSTADIQSLVASYVRTLREIAGPQHGYVYRAGGWVVQPFEHLRTALKRAAVTIDSSVFPGGIASGEEHVFDFRQAPRSGHWRFSSDPSRPDPEGDFLEVPISSLRVMPEFYWRFALHKKFGGARAKQLGDGSAISLSRSDLMRKLLLSSSSVASMDGYKSTLLQAGHAQYQRLGAPEYVVIGHPKALSPFSLQRLDHFLSPERCKAVTGYAPYLA